jgi:S-adenosylmethionine-dependent methyltransferase
VTDVEALLTALWPPLRSNGILSFIGVNRYSEVYRQALQRLDLPAAQQALDTTTTASTLFDVPIRLYAPDDLLPLFQTRGYKVIGLYGLVSVCGYIENNDIKYEPDFFSQLEELENAVSDKHPYNLLARFYQIMACKVTRED